MANIKYFIGPMSKNVVDTIIEFCNKTKNEIALIPSRRQIEWNGGYVNNWTTDEFGIYSKSIVLQRDHAGPNQGIIDDDGYESLKHDCKHFNLIHIDPWKKYYDFNLGLNETIRMIEFCYKLNPNIEYEVGTEESIRRFEVYELNELMQNLQKKLSTDVYKKIKYLVIQSGTSLKGNIQTGSYDSERLKDMIDVCKKFNVLSKEHNGDYIEVPIIKQKFSIGLDSINIAPEFGLIETQTYLDAIKDDKIFDTFWKICFNSKKWVKWVNSDFNPYLNKLELIKICGHYVLSYPEFISEIKSNFLDIDDTIKNNILKKLNQLYE